jgi:hypothetical protein
MAHTARVARGLALVLPPVVRVSTVPGRGVASCSSREVGGLPPKSRPLSSVQEALAPTARQRRVALLLAGLPVQGWLERPWDWAEERVAGRGV